MATPFLHLCLFLAFASVSTAQEVKTGVKPTLPRIRLNNLLADKGKCYPGPCEAAIKKWFFNFKTKKCEVFIYGGCKGNGNRFDSKEACEAKCAPKKVNICKLPRDSGPCKGLFFRWYFNPKTGRCEQFAYGGCKGNKNNFETRFECQKACRKDCDFVQCFANPCEVIQCDAFPKADCVPNFCTGCDADFFVKGKLVDCKKKPGLCTPAGGNCRNPAFANDVGATTGLFVPPCCKGTSCCACGPPIVKEGSKPPRFGKCRRSCVCPIG